MFTLFKKKKKCLKPKTCEYCYSDFGFVLLFNGREREKKDSNGVCNYVWMCIFVMDVCMCFCVCVLCLPTYDNCGLCLREIGKNGVRHLFESTGTFL